MRVTAGTTVAAAILIVGKEHFRTSVSGEPRGPLWFANNRSNGKQLTGMASTQTDNFSHMRMLLDSV